MVAQSIFASRYASLTVGIILAAMTIGFEGLAVITVAPVIAGDLQGLHLFGWIFSAYLLAQIIGTLVVGRYIDKQGPALPFTIAIILFAIGLVIAAVATNIYVLISSRALQGFGAGAMYTCIYTAISLSYPDELRAKILGALGTAYILPAMLGPFLAGLIASQWSWRFVFWGVLPFLLLAFLLSMPVFSKLKMIATPAAHASGVIRLAALLAIGTGLFLNGLGMLPKIMGVVQLAAGLALMVQPLRKLLPAGAFSLRPGLPSLIGSRGLFFAAYDCTQIFLVLALTDTKGVSAETAGLIVASAALSWSIVAILQARWDAVDQGRGRHKRIQAGIVLMIFGIAVIVWVPAIHIALALFGVIVAGLGMGLAHTVNGTVAFSMVKDGEAGQLSGSLQFADSFTPGIVIGIGGAVVAINHSMGMPLEIGITIVMFFNLGLIILSLFASRRARHSASR